MSMSELNVAYRMSVDEYEDQLSRCGICFDVSFPNGWFDDCCAGCGCCGCRCSTFHFPLHTLTKQDGPTPSVLSKNIYINTFFIKGPDQTNWRGPLLP